MTTASLLWSLFFGSIGIGLSIYGTKQKKPVPLICGLALMILPYFIVNTILLVAAGMALTALPYFVRT